MADLAGMTPKALAKVFEARSLVMSKASDALFAVAGDGFEKFGAICDRLGAVDPRVVAYREASAARLEVEVECAVRYGSGAVMFPSGWPTFLRVRGGSKPRVRSAA